MAICSNLDKPSGAHLEYVNLTSYSTPASLITWLPSLQEISKQQIRKRGRGCERQAPFSSQKGHSQL